MRNDALDELETVPSLTTDVGDRNSAAQAVKTEPVLREPLQASVTSAPASRGVSTGPLWALLGALLIAFCVLAWWSSQQIGLLNQQLVATQESFAQISEDAAGRIKDISGKVVATESNVTTESESIKLRIKQLETQSAEQGRKQQGAGSVQLEQGKQLEKLAVALKGQATSLQQADEKIQKLSEVQSQLKSTQAQLSKVEAQLKAQGVDLVALKQQGHAQVRLEQDLLILRSEVDNQAAKGNSTAEFDAFRTQISRQLEALQSQVQTLQQPNAPR